MTEPLTTRAGRQLLAFMHLYVRRTNQPLGDERDRLVDLWEQTAEDLPRIEAEARDAERARLREAVETLPRHDISGYEWDCDYDYDYDMVGGRPYVSDASDHTHLLDRADVLRLLTAGAPDSPSKP